jgi:hypothetical protein
MPQLALSLKVWKFPLKVWKIDIEVGGQKDRQIGRYADRGL